MTGFLKRSLVLLLAGWLAACGAGQAPAPPPPADAGPKDRTIWVVSNGWHTEIALDRVDLKASRAAPPEIEDLPEARYLSFSWGDRAYFKERNQSLGAVIEAAITPTPAVLHLVGLDGPPPEAYAHLAVYELSITEAGLERLVAAMSAAFTRDGEARAQPVAPGLMTRSFFYDARGEFHLFNTCNTWTARMLRTAGVDISPAGVMTASHVTGRLADLAEEGS
ncbi:MAG: DUF2459 domain-containing protein [Marivibrio sp.]|uniref:DUF2459 domain-containing protein n=1 Tax=Marivibrio sp. TaxID=2039719 RepID=UPI0032EBE82A